MRKNNNKPEVSIIVPIYNAENYLERCLQSLQEQTASCFEVILINDGSSDNSEAICKRYVEADARFHLFSQENQGVSAARNLGVAQAKGSYLMFVDSDDAAEPTFIARMLETEQACAAELVIADYRQYSEQPEESDMRHFTMPEGIYTRKAFLRKMTRCPGAHYIGVLWNKLYRTDIVRKLDLAFDSEVSLGEDFIFNMQYLTAVRTVCCISDRLYLYRWMRVGSLDLMKKPEAQRMEERVRMYRAYIQLFEKVHLAKRWQLLINYYIIKAYFDELEELGADAKAYQPMLYQSFIRANGIGPVRFRFFAILKKVKRLRK